MTRPRGEDCAWRQAWAPWLMTNDELSHRQVMLLSCRSAETATS